MPIPPGVSEQDFKRALDRFTRVVGDQWVFTSDEDVALYRDAYSPLWSEHEERVASAAVAPDSAEQVQEIVRIANEFRVPLYPISTGRNLGYGGSAPVLSGSVVLDLKRMNRILEVERAQRLRARRAGRQLLRPLPPHPGARPEAVDRLPRSRLGQRHRQRPRPRRGLHDEPVPGSLRAQCGMEVVTGSGDLVRTGMGALPGAKTWQQFKYGFGPYLDGIFSQSNFGVVTKMGVWLMPEPEAYLDGARRGVRPRRHHSARRPHERT